MGFATHFAGLAHVATGSLDAGGASASNAPSSSPRATAPRCGKHIRPWSWPTCVARSDDPHLLAESRLMLAALRDSPVVCASNRLARTRDRGWPRRRRTLTTSAVSAARPRRGMMEHWPRWFHPPVIGRGAAWTTALLLLAMIAAGCSGPPKEEVLIQITPKVAGMLTVATTLPAPGFWEGRRCLHRRWWLRVGPRPVTGR